MVLEISYRNYIDTYKFTINFHFFHISKQKYNSTTSCFIQVCVILISITRAGEQNQAPNLQDRTIAPQKENVGNF